MVLSRLCPQLFATILATMTQVGAAQLGGWVLHSLSRRDGSSVGMWRVGGGLGALRGNTHATAPHLSSQVEGEQQGFMFDPVTLEPLVDTPAGKRVTAFNV